MKSSEPASILAMSNTSLISCRSSWLLFSIILIYSLFSSSSSAVASMEEKPTIALSGVRISWLMFARKADFSRSDSSARFLAFMSSCSFRLRSVMISRDPMSEIGCPCSFLCSTTARASTQLMYSLPFFLMTVRNSSFSAFTLPKMSAW